MSTSRATSGSVPGAGASAAGSTPPATAWRLETGPGGIAVLTLDLPGSRVNLLGTEVFREFGRRLGEIAHDPEIRGLLIASGKPDHFLAGADVGEIRSVREAGEGQDKAIEAQRIFRQLTELRIPTCAAIEGACMGGGLELALACRYRLASDTERTSLALPEVKLGLIPALGGTTRLPRRIGLLPALDLLLTGRAVNARRALRLGLVDDVLPHESFRARALRQFGDWVEREVEWAPRRRGRGAEPDRVARRRRPPWWRTWLVDRNPLGRRIVLAQAERRVRRETGGHYPAPLRILEVLRETAGKPEEAGLRAEAVAFGDLLVTPACRNLTALFFLIERAKHDPDAARALSVERTAVLGAGIMGGGIAALFARRGLTVRLKDITHEAVSQGLRTAHGLYRKELRRRRITPRELRRRMERISGTVTYTGFRRVDFALEAVVESLEIKRRVLAELEDALPDRAVIATNTSSLGLDAIAEGLRRPERLVGLHFFNPVHRMPLVEVIVGDETGEEARDTALALARRLGKTPVVVRSSPGFLVNRVLMPYLMEALVLFEQGVSIENLDAALEKFGMPMGPLALLDEIGIDVALKVATVLQASFPDRGDPPEVLAPMVEGERLGKKNGRGFYRHQHGGRQPDPAVYSLVRRPSRSAVQAGPEVWVERLVLSMVNEAARSLEQGLVADAQRLDLAMILGTGFPPFRGGLLRYADTLGLARVVDRLEAFAQSEGARFAPAALLRDRAAARSRFRDDFPG